MDKKKLFPARETGIMLAADVPELDDLTRLVELAVDVPGVVAVKVGFSLALRYGLGSVVNAVRGVSSLAVIYDHQKAATDIPAMGDPFAALCQEAGVDGVILFPQAGPKTLESFVSAAFDYDLVPIVGVVMTHPAYLQSEGGYVSDDAPDSIYRTAIGLGVEDFVLPGNKTDFVARFASHLNQAGKPATILMPGIGSQGGDVVSALQAAAPHRRFAIVGSAIYKASDPQAAMRTLAKEAGL
ncbi:MAG: orotidine 5'-phosphate decarboxylase / HUMPS family protein [Candidatus Latescibacterota bacterium]